MVEFRSAMPKVSLLDELLSLLPLRPILAGAGARGANLHSTHMAVKNSREFSIACRRIAAYSWATQFLLGLASGAAIHAQ